MNGSTSDVQSRPATRSTTAGGPNGRRAALAAKAEQEATALQLRALQEAIALKAQREWAKQYPVQPWTTVIQPAIRRTLANRQRKETINGATLSIHVPYGFTPIRTTMAPHASTKHVLWAPTAQGVDAWISWDAHHIHRFNNGKHAKTFPLPIAAKKSIRAPLTTSTQHNSGAAKKEGTEPVAGPPPAANTKVHDEKLHINGLAGMVRWRWIPSWRAILFSTQQLDVKVLR